MTSTLPTKTEGSGSPLESSSERILVLGSTGIVGRSTVRALTKAGFFVVATTRDRNSEKARYIDGSNVELRQVTDSEHLKSAASGCNLAILIAPAMENRVHWARENLENLKSCGIKNFIVMSIPHAKPDAHFEFGRQFGEIEQLVKESGVNACIVRLPLFMENLYGSKDVIKEGKLYWVPKPDAAYSAVSVVCDVGEAIAAIARNFDRYSGKELLLSATPFCGQDIVNLCSKTLGQRVEIVNINDESFVNGARKMGLPEWLGRGVLELFKMVDDGQLLFDTKDLATLLGREPTNLHEFANGDFKLALQA